MKSKQAWSTLLVQDSQGQVVPPCLKQDKPQVYKTPYKAPDNKAKYSSTKVTLGNQGVWAYLQNIGDPKTGTLETLCPSWILASPWLHRQLPSNNLLYPLDVPKAMSS